MLAFTRPSQCSGLDSPPDCPDLALDWTWSWICLTLPDLWSLLGHIFPQAWLGFPHLDLDLASPCMMSWANAASYCLAFDSIANSPSLDPAPHLILVLTQSQIAYSQRQCLYLATLYWSWFLLSYCLCLHLLLIPKRRKVNPHIFFTILRSIQPHSSKIGILINIVWNMS